MGGISVSGGFSPANLDVGRFDNALAPTGALAETFPRQTRPVSIASQISGTLVLCAIYLPSGLAISSITFFSGATALVTGSNQWFALYNSALAKLAVTADDTSTAWGANAAKTLTISGGYTTTASGLHYVGICVVASTVPSLTGQDASVANLWDVAPDLSGRYDTGLTNPASAPATATRSAALAVYPYAWVS
jgi:hypothetical protein